jgi:hypothetical protein
MQQITLVLLSDNPFFGPNKLSEKCNGFFSTNVFSILSHKCLSKEIG